MKAIRSQNHRKPDGLFSRFWLAVRWSVRGVWWVSDTVQAFWLNQYISLVYGWAEMLRSAWQSIESMTSMRARRTLQVWRCSQKDTQEGYIFLIYEKLHVQKSFLCCKIVSWEVYIKKVFLWCARNLCKYGGFERMERYWTLLLDVTKFGWRVRGLSWHIPQALALI